MPDLQRLGLRIKYLHRAAYGDCDEGVVGTVLAELEGVLESALDRSKGAAFGL